MKDFYIYLNLLYTFSKLGFFTYGGGYVTLALLFQTLQVQGWSTAAEFSNLVAISQITPGPIAINAATYVGYKVAGNIGSAFATFGIFIPCFVVTIIIFKFFNNAKNNPYFRSVMTYIRAASVALIFSAGINIAKGAFFVDLNKSSILSNVPIIKDIFEFISPVAVLIFLLSIFLNIRKVPIIIIIFIAAALGLILY